MIKKIILCSLIAACSNAYAEFDFVKTCPAPNRITAKKFTLRGRSYTLQATNYEGKVFRSDPLAATVKNRFLHPLVLIKEQSTYAAVDKKLTCVYLAIDIRLAHVKLSNIGDY